MDDSPTSSKSDPETDCDRLQDSAIVSVDDKRNRTRVTDTFCSPWKGERRRRKLPEIPKNKKGECPTDISFLTLFVLLHLRTYLPNIHILGI